MGPLLSHPGMIVSSCLRYARVIGSGRGQSRRPVPVLRRHCDLYPYRSVDHRNGLCRCPGLGALDPFDRKFPGLCCFVGPVRPGRYRHLWAYRSPPFLLVAKTFLSKAGPLSKMWNFHFSLPDPEKAIPPPSMSEPVHSAHVSGRFRTTVFCGLRMHWGIMSPIATSIMGI